MVAVCTTAAATMHNACVAHAQQLTVNLHQFNGIFSFAANSYANVNIFDIEKDCGITCDSLVEYFDSLSEYYLYCLNFALEKVFGEEPTITSSDLYGMVISSIDNKLRRCSEYYNEIRFIHLALKETDSEVVKGKTLVFSKHCEKLPVSTSEVIARSAKNLRFDEPCDRLVSEALTLYINAIIIKFLLQYQEMPDDFIKKTDRLKEEICNYVDYMLYNVIKGDTI